MSTLSRDGPIAARAVVAAACGLAVAIGVGVSVQWNYAPACGWITAAAVFLIWTWAVIAKMSPARTGSHATREDPTRVATDIFILSASVASLLGVACLFAAGQSHGVQADIAAVVGVGSVGAAWLVVHTIFTLRYALLYYADSAGGIDFNQSEAPAYADFAYLAFTIGMTYQVSDTDLKTSPIRVTALRHGLLSFLLGAVILGAAVNLVAGLAH